MIKYLTETIDYKQYCEKGREYVIPKPEVCPFCDKKDCLIGHGWYKRKGLSGVEPVSHEIFIKRILCKVTGKTISIHPIFSHVRKWYHLSFVIDCLVKLFEKAHSLSTTAKEMRVPRQTLNRWKNSFATKQNEAKQICFTDTGQNSTSLPHKMFSYFRKHDSGSLSSGAAAAMVHLQELYNASLY